ncbi:MAG: MFS transporter [Patulibacter sp.]
MTPQTAPPDSRRWYVLAVLALAQFMVVLDVTIVNVALPDIQRALGFSTEGLQWVVNAYTLAFGGLLLLGGRTADLLGRRRMFLAGMALFVVASLVAGLSGSAEMLVAARAVQGIGAALLSPAALALLMVSFPAGRERNVALGIWGALAGIGGTLGVIAGGVLVDGLGWQWIFLVNLPIGLAVLVAAPLRITESRGAMERRSFDLAGAALSTAGVLAIVYGVIRSEPAGWGSVEVIGLLGGGIALLAAFVAVELRTAAPLIPMRLFRSRGLSASSVSLALNGGIFLAMFFLTALYLQNVRGASAVEAGLQFVPMGIAAVASAILGGQLVTRLGTRPVFAVGAILSGIGLLLLAQASVDGAYVTDVLPGLLVFGFGLSMVGVPNQIAAIMDVEPTDAGAASGVITAAFQIGGALGLAVITTLANARVGDALATGATQGVALTEGFHRGLTVAALLAAVNIVLALTLAPSKRPDEAQLNEAMAAA